MERLNKYVVASPLVSPAMSATYTGETLTRQRFRHFILIIYLKIEVMCRKECARLGLYYEVNRGKINNAGRRGGNKTLSCHLRSSYISVVPRVNLREQELLAASELAFRSGALSHKKT